MTKFWWKYLRRYCIDPVLRAVKRHLQWPWSLIPKANQHIDEPKYICDQNLVKFTSLCCEILCSQGFLVIACCDLGVLTFWLNEYVPGPDTYITKFWWNQLKYLQKYRIHPVFGSLPPVTLTHKSMNLNYICDQISLHWTNNLWQTWNEPQNRVTLVPPDVRF